MVVYIIEHLEPRIWRWCIIEYKHISRIVGKNNLWFTNMKRGSKELEKYGKVIKEKVSELNLKKVAVLDPEASELLTPINSKKSDYFIFGGILGDHPPKKRTKKELTDYVKGAVAYNIGKKQMSTDNAVYTVKKIVDGTKFEEIRFKDKIEVKLGKYASNVFPYRYAMIDGKPLISKELVSYLKRRKGF
jgi:ribosome biogenesis SPOUT family RNA methylase Rps3